MARTTKSDPTRLYRMSEEEARAFLEGVRWPNGPVCCHCGSTNIKPLQGKATRPGVYKCREKGCRKQSTVTTGTIFHGSHIPLRDWVYAFGRMCASKKGISALQLKRELGLAYKSAWHLCHRIRHAMQQDPLRTMLAGEIESDETWIGGRPRNSISRQQRRAYRKAGWGIKKSEKTPVMALIQRDGKARTRVICDVGADTLREVIQANVDPSRSTLFTDEHLSYRPIGREFAGGHKSVNHSKKEYFRHSDGAGVNLCESYFGLLKRGVHGTFHQISSRHLNRYLDEFDFRWNHRDVSDYSRTVSAIRGAEGKRLTYNPLTAKPAPKPIPPGFSVAMSEGDDWID